MAGPLDPQVPAGPERQEPPVWVRFARSGLFDQEFYEAVSGRTFEHRRAAARHFVEFGMAAGLSPNPFLVTGWLPQATQELYRAGNVVRLMAFMRWEPALTRPTGPLFRGLESGFPADPMVRGGPLGQFLENAAANTPMPVPPTHPAQVPTYGQARERLLQHARLVTAQSYGGRPTARGAKPVRPTPGRVSVLVPVGPDAAAVIRTVGSLLQRNTYDNIEFVLVEGDQPHAVGHDVIATFAAEPGVHYHRLGRDIDDEESARVAATLATGDRIILLPAGVESRTDWVGRAARTLADEPVLSGVQPVMLASDDTIVAAGNDALRGLPPEDAPELAQALAPDGPVMYRADRPTPRSGGRPVDAGGLILVLGEGVLSSPDRTPYPPPVPQHQPPAARRHRLQRWGIRNPAPPGPRGDAWGDSHFAGSLAAALRRRGKHVVTHRHVPGRAEDPDTSAAGLDDVVVTLRGFHAMEPVPGTINVLWVLSHPDDVADDELEGYDVVLAASSQWAQERSTATGREVGVLLQAADTDLVRTDLPLGDGSVAAFVGSTHPQRPRPMVGRALEARVPVAVWGPGWSGLVPAENHRGEYLANADLLATYRRYGLVLCDHWPDMAGHGFLSNRLFDAVAAGARVICDRVPGIELFSGAVVAAQSVEEIAALGPGDFPEPGELARIAEQVRAEHSFDARAGQLEDLVLHAVRGPSERS